MILSAAVFGSKHLFGLGVVILLVVGTLFIIEKKEVKSKLVITALTISFLVIEAIKLTFITINNGEFPLNHIPLHLCSLPLYVYPIFLWSKLEQTKQFILPAMYATVMFGGLIALLYPVNILGSEETWALSRDNFLPYISFLYHGLMLLGSIFLIRSGIYEIRARRIKEAFIVTFIFMCFAMITNVILDKDFMLLNYGNGSPFQFIHDISPLLYTMTMIVVGFIAVAIFHFTTLLFVKKPE